MINGSYTSGENLYREYKDDRKDWSDQKLIESVAAMSNAEGGEILVGVTDQKEVVGCTNFSRGHWNDDGTIVGIVLANTQPAVFVSVTRLTIEGKEVACIKVLKGVTTIGTKKGKYLKRVLDPKGKPQNLPMTPDQILAGITRVGTTDFSSTALHGSSIKDIDLQLVKANSSRVLGTSQTEADKAIFKQAPEDVLKSLGLLSHDHQPNVACLLLFGTRAGIRSRIANHVVQYQEFGPTGEVLENLGFYDAIAAAFPRLMQLQRLQRNSDEFRFNGTNVVIPEYSGDSIREALANALVHRDYTVPSGIQIQVFDKELIVTSPGGFPAGVHHHNLLSVPPTPRNRRLAEAMAKLRFVENSGRGIDFIFAGQARYGRPAPDYSPSDNDRVCVRLGGGKANLDFCRFVLATAKDLSARELLLLNAMFFKGYVLGTEAAEIIQQPKSVTEELLFSLNKKGLVEISPEELPRYFIKASIHHTTRHLVKPARIKKGDMERYKKLILSELHRRSPSTTNDVADAVGLSAPQAYRLLQRLRDDRKVALSKGATGKKWQLPAGSV